MEKMLAYCGLVCTDCPAYIATQSNDPAAMEKVAEQWRKQFNMPQITADSILCDGCTLTGGRLSGYCQTCKIRACAMDRSVPNCAHCADYACEDLRGFFVHAPEA
jgi:hypothetical protein